MVHCVVYNALNTNSQERYEGLQRQIMIYISGNKFCKVSVLSRQKKLSQFTFCTETTQLSQETGVMAMSCRNYGLFLHASAAVMSMNLSYDSSAVCM